MRLIAVVLCGLLAFCVGAIAEPVIVEVGDTVTIEYGFADLFEGELAEVSWEYTYPGVLEVQMLSQLGVIQAFYDAVDTDAFVKGHTHGVNVREGVVATVTFKAIAPTPQVDGEPVAAQIGNAVVTALDSNGAPYTVNVVMGDGVIVLPKVEPPRPVVQWFFRYRAGN